MARVNELQSAGRAFAVFAGRSDPLVSRMTTDGPALQAAFEAGREAIHRTFRW
jgi:hypothetical protein